MNVYRTETTIWWGSYYCLIASETPEQATKILKEHHLDKMYTGKWEKVDIRHEYNKPTFIDEYFLN